MPHIEFLEFYLTIAAFVGGIVLVLVLLKVRAKIANKAKILALQKSCNDRYFQARTNEFLEDQERRIQASLGWESSRTRGIR